MRNISFTPSAFKEYNEWVNEDFEVLQKNNSLIERDTEGSI